MNAQNLTDVTRAKAMIAAGCDWEVTVTDTRAEREYGLCAGYWSKETSEPFVYVNKAKLEVFADDDTHEFHFWRSEIAEIVGHSLICQLEDDLTEKEASA